MVFLSTIVCGGIILRCDPAGKLLILSIKMLRVSTDMCGNMNKLSYLSCKRIYHLWLPVLIIALCSVLVEKNHKLMVLEKSQYSFL